MTSKSATLNAVNDFVGAYRATAKVDLAAPTHALSSNFGKTYYATEGHPVSFGNTSDKVQHLGADHFREANYQDKVELPVNRLMTAASIPGAAARDVAAVSSGGWCNIL